jgi:hypothetical protein
MSYSVSWTLVVRWSLQPLNLPCDLTAGTHTATERPYLQSYFRAKLEETLNEVREEEKLDSEGKYEVIMSEENEIEVVQFV